MKKKMKESGKRKGKRNFENLQKTNERNCKFEKNELSITFNIYGVIGYTLCNNSF